MLTASLTLAGAIDVQPAQASGVNLAKTAEIQAPLVGAGGGSKKNVSCPEGYALTRVYFGSYNGFYSGASADFGGLCTQLNSDGTLGSATSRITVLNGTDASASCPSGQVAVGLRAARKGDYVGAMGLYCADPLNLSSVTSVGGGAFDSVSQCPAAGIVTGLGGFIGSVVDKARALCSGFAFTQCSGASCQIEFDFFPATYSWSPPSGLPLEITALGAAGGGLIGSAAFGSGGAGGRTQGSYTASAGQTIHVGVGQKGSQDLSATFNGGGSGNPGSNGNGFSGGGASHVALTSGALSGLSSNTANVILVAGGGGGAAGGDGYTIFGANGGSGGGLTGSSGQDSNNNPNYRKGGAGGTQSAGGASGNTPSRASGFGLGASAITSGGDAIQGGGGGGGWYGGGAGSHPGGAGGGGSSYLSGSLSGASTVAGQNSDSDGSVTITFVAGPDVTSFTPAATTVNSRTTNLNLNFSNQISGLGADDFDFSNSTAQGCIASPNATSGSAFVISVTCASDGTLNVFLKADSTTLVSSGFAGPAANFLLSSSVEIDTGPPNLAIYSPNSPSSTSSLTFTVSSSETLTTVTAGDFSVQGTGCSIGTPSGPSGSAPNILYTIPVSGCQDAQSVTLTLLQGAVQDAAGNTAPASAIVSDAVIVDLTAPTGFVSGDSITNSNPVVFTVSLSETIQGVLGESNFTVGGTGCTFDSITPASSDYTVALAGCEDGTTATLTLNANGVFDLAGNSGPSSPVVAQTIVDRSLAAITIDSPASPNSSSNIAFAVNLGESTNNIEESDFEILSPSTFSCTLDTFNPASPRNSETGVFSVGLSGCAHGDQIALQLKQNSFQDDLGNLGPLTAVSSSYVVLDLEAPVLVSVAAVNDLLTNQSTITYSVTLNETVTGLDASMFILDAGTGCSGAILGGSLSSYTVTFTGCASADEVTMIYALTDAVLDLAGNPLVPVSGSLPTITVDTIAPSITSLTKTQSETSVAYRIDFSEEVAGFTADDIQFAGTSAAGSTWSVTNLVSITATRYQFTATNPSADSGTLKFSITTTGVTDLAGNQLASAAFEVASVDQSEATFYFLPTISLGSLSSLGAMANSIAPAVTIDGRGNSLFGLQVMLTNAEPEDVLTFTNNDSSAFGTIQSGTHNSVLTLTFTGTQPTAAQWQAAARNITFATTSLASVSRSVTFAIRPTEGYSFDTGRFYEVKSNPEYTFKSWADSIDQAAGYNLGGLGGYLVNITSQQEQDFVENLANGAAAWIGMNDVPSNGEILIKSGPEAGQSPTYTNWASNQPNGSGDYAMMSTAGDWYDIQDQTAEVGSLAVSILIVEFGGSVSDPQTQLSVTAPLEIDSTPPTVVGVSGVTEDGTYYRGEETLIAVEFSEQVVVTGTPRLLLETGTTDRYANYVSGSGTVTAVFSYQIESGDVASDLDFESNAALEANSGTLTDLVGNPAVLTLPAPGAADSLAANSALVVDGVQLSMVLSSATTSSAVRTLTYTLTATDPIDCNTLSLTLGEDLEGTLVESIDSVVASVDNKTCTIGITSAVMPAQFGTTTLTYTQGFSVSDQVANPQTNIRLGQTSVVLTVPAAAPDLGETTVSESPGVMPQQFLKSAPSGLLPNAGDSAKTELNSAGVVQSVAGLTSRLAISDISGVTNTSSALHAKSKIEIAAGEELISHLKVDQSTFTGHNAVSYFDSGNGWVFSGVKEVVSSPVETEPVVFTAAGNYMIRILLLPAGASYPTLGQGLTLPAANQSQHWEVLVTGTVPTFVPPPPTQPQGVLPFPAPPPVKSDPEPEPETEIEQEESETCTNCSTDTTPTPATPTVTERPTSGQSAEQPQTSPEVTEEDLITETDESPSSLAEAVTDEPTAAPSPSETEEVVAAAPDAPEQGSGESMLGWFVLAMLTLAALFGARRFQASRQKSTL